MNAYTVTLWTTAGHEIPTIVVATNREEAEKRARLIRSEYILHANRAEVEER